MRPIDKKNLLADIEGLKKSPWFNADYISNERRLGMKEALDMMSSIIRNAPTIDAATDWHYTEDGMPEEENDYLITYKLFGHRIVTAAWYRTDEKRFVEPHYCEEYPNVIAWAELPKPAERKEE